MTVFPGHSSVYRGFPGSTSRQSIYRCPWAGLVSKGWALGSNPQCHSSLGLHPISQEEPDLSKFPSVTVIYFPAWSHVHRTALPWVLPLTSVWGPEVARRQPWLCKRVFSRNLAEVAVAWK